MMEKNVSAIILMACYNGEKFISSQIESIRDQTFQNWKLLIRDDGSNDNTVEIINNFSHIDSRIELLQNDTNKHEAYLNFFTLINYTKQLNKYDYYFFADQDDIWLNDKLEKMICIGENETNKEDPILVYGDMQVINKEGTLVYESLDKIMGIGKISGLSLFFTHGYLWGCDIMVNHALFELVPCYPLDDDKIAIMSHDNYFGKFALICGRIIFLPEICIMHRRHDNNKTGSYNMKLSPLKVFKRVILEFQDLSKTHARVYNQTLQTIVMMRAIGIDDYRLKEIETAIYKGGVYAIRILRKFNVKRKQWTRTLGIYIIMFLGSYKKYIY